MLESFFLNGAIPVNAEKGTYIPVLVLISYIVASFGSYAGLTLAVRLFDADTRQKKRVLHWTGAFALGGGIWSMHFIGMLAYKMDMAVDYDPLLTVLSFLIAMVAGYVVLGVVSRLQLLRRQILASAVGLGIGISAMHYAGMAAMKMDAALRYLPGFFLLSLLIGIMASAVALWTAFTLPRHVAWRPAILRIGAALVMGAAVCGMHYTGMVAAVFIPYADCCHDSGQSFALLATAVIVVTIVLLTGTLTLTLSRRLFLVIGCGALFSLPLFIVVYQAITALNLNIRTAEKEQYGIQYHNRLVNLLQCTQDVRDLSYAAHSEAAAFTGMVVAAKEELHQALSAIDNVDQSYENLLAVGQGWESVRKEILLPLETKNPPPPAEEFKQYSNAIQALTDFMADLSDNSEITSDPQLDSDYLADALTQITPDIMQTLGRMRGSTIGLLAYGQKPLHWTEKEMPELEALYNNLLLQDKDMENGLGRAKRANASSRQFIEYHDQAIEPVLEEFQKHYEQMIFAHTNDLSTLAFFKLASRTIALYDTLYDKISDAFLDLLNQRKQEFTLTRNLVLYSSTAAFFGFIALFVFLYRTLSRTERAEQGAVVASRAKSDFLANMSHELRTPLNTILGMLHLLRVAKLGEEEHNLADSAFRSSTNLLEIVNDILDLSKIEAGEMQLERIGMDLDYALDNIIHTLGHIAAEKRVPLVPHKQSERFPYVLGDPTRFVRILNNLIGNAIKFTDEGHIDIYPSFTKLDDKHIEFRCEIKDTGIGIPKEKQAGIFKKFSQADTSTTRRYGGTGLGLAITRQLVDLMGGAIGVESELGAGSTFWFTIPFEVTDALNEEKHIRRKKRLLGVIPPEKARILVAEDHPMNQMLMTKLLKSFGIGFAEIAENGLVVLKRVHEASWDLILMDGHMPGKNGYDTTQEIREIEKGTGAHIPIVAMTANAMVGDREKCLRYGMDEYISKPINVDELKEVMGQWIAFKKPADSAKDALPASNGNMPLDLSMLKSFSEGDVEMEKKLVGAFVDQSDKNLKMLAENRANTGAKAWQETAHMLKGGASGIGANGLASLCNEAQHFEGTSLEQAALFEKINGEYARVKDHLKGIGLLP